MIWLGFASLESGSAEFGGDLGGVFEGDFGVGLSASLSDDLVLAVGVLGAVRRMVLSDAVLETGIEPLW